MIRDIPGSPVAPDYQRFKKHRMAAIQQVASQEKKHFETHRGKAQLHNTLD